jgi:hypothetical protein
MRDMAGNLKARFDRCEVMGGSFYATPGALKSIAGCFDGA